MINVTGCFWDGGATTPVRGSAPLSSTVIRRSSQLLCVDMVNLEDSRMCVKDVGLAHFHSGEAKITQDRRKLFTLSISSLHAKQLQ